MPAGSMINLTPRLTARTASLGGSTVWYMFTYAGGAATEPDGQGGMRCWNRHLRGAVPQGMIVFPGAAARPAGRGLAPG